jgi:hypothetical protein
MITVWLLVGRAEPGANSGTVRVLPTASAPWAVLSPAKSSLGQSARSRASYYPFERVLAEAIGEDLGQSGNSLIPRIAALSAVAGLGELYSWTG